MLSTFVLTAKTKTEMFQFRIWTINQTASLGKFLSTKKSYLDTYREETHLHSSEVFIKALLAHVLFFPLTISHSRWEQEKIVCSLVIK